MQDLFEIVFAIAMFAAMVAFTSLFLTEPLTGELSNFLQSF